MHDAHSINRIVESIRKTKAISRRLDKAAQGKEVIFQPVDENAQAFVAALVSGVSGRNTWIICKDVRTQEDLAAELAAWNERVLLFPEMQTAKNALPDAETDSERIALLQQLAAVDTRGNLLVVTNDQLQELVASPQSLKAHTRVISKGDSINPQKLAEELIQAGYDGQPQVFARGQFSLRGGILDVFSWQHALPVRIEFFGDDIESLREFELDTQISIRVCESIELILGELDDSRAPLRDYLHKKDLVIAVDVESDDAKVFLSSDHSEKPDDAVTFFSSGFSAFGAGDFVLDESRRERLLDQIREWLDAKWDITVFCNNEGEAERLGEILESAEIPVKSLTITLGGVTRGFLYPEAPLAVLSDAEIFGRAASQRARRAVLRRERARARTAAVNFSDFEEGDLIIHLEHGVGRFAGLQKFPLENGVESDVLTLEFAETAKLYVPLDQAWKISRYVGLGRKSPPLSELGDAKWERQKRTAERAIAQYAASLLKLHAERETSQGHAFRPDTEWQREFENSFLFDETRSVVRTISRRTWNRCVLWIACFAEMWGLEKPRWPFVPLSRR
ncbi:MAG: CarD family transcriptional regulator [Chthoniobacterales bacterium]